MLSTVLAFTVLAVAGDVGDVPTYEVRGAEPSAVVPVPDHVYAAFLRVLAPDPPPDGPVLIVGDPIPRPRLPLPSHVVPHGVGEFDAEDANFLLAISELVPAEQLDPKTAGQLADRFYTEGRTALAAAQADLERARETCRLWGWCPDRTLDATLASSWMARALPLYRRATSGTVRHPDRLAVRLAWAARLGGGTTDDLDAANRLLRESPPSPWTDEARLVLGDSWMQRETWNPPRAVEVLEPIAWGDGAAGPTVAYAAYSAGWAEFYTGEDARAIERMKEAVHLGEASDAGVLESARRDLRFFFAEAGEEYVESPERVYGKSDVAGMLRYLTLTYAERWQYDLAATCIHRLVESGEPSESLAAFAVQLPVVEALLEPLLPALMSAGGADGDRYREEEASRVAESAARGHYAYYGDLGPEYTERLRRLYALSLSLDPDSPNADAIRVLVEDLGP